MNAHSDLHKWSSLLSCQAMSELAMKEAHTAHELQLLQMNHPSHRRFCERLDPTVEHQTMAANLSRRLCYDPCTRAHSGPYVDRFGAPCEARFDVSTRNKDFAPNYAPKTVRPIDNVFWNYYGNAPTLNCKMFGVPAVTPI